MNKQIQVGSKFIKNISQTRVDGSKFETMAMASVTGIAGGFAEYKYDAVVVDPVLNTKFLGGRLSIKEMDFMEKNGMIGTQVDRCYQAGCKSPVTHMVKAPWDNNKTFCSCDKHKPDINNRPAAIRDLPFCYVVKPIN